MATGEDFRSVKGTIVKKKVHSQGSGHRNDKAHPMMGLCASCPTDLPAGHIHCTSLACVDLACQS